MQTDYDDLYSANRKHWTLFGKFSACVRTTLPQVSDVTRQIGCLRSIGTICLG